MKKKFLLVPVMLAVFVPLLMTGLLFSCNNNGNSGNGANMPAEPISPNNKGDGNFRPEPGDNPADVSTTTDSTRDNQRNHSTH